jgi:outer membrane receptor protein involved in Fe transport
VTTVGGAAESQGNETFVQNVTVGGFVQQQLDWENRLFLTTAVRVDDNSAFGERSSAAVYPKVSGAWVLHEEDFFEVPGVSQLRLRFAWGQSGMQPDAFDAARLFSVQTGPGDVPIFTPSSFGNPDLQPEVGSEWEIGFDAGFLRDRISMEFTQFFKTTEDAIVQQGLAPSGGFPGSQLVNLANVDNWGTEVAVRGVVTQTASFRWELGGSWSYQRNEIDDLGEDRESIAVSGVVGPGSRQHREGFSLAGWFTPRVLSAEFVDGQSGPVTNLMCDGGTGRGGVEMGGEPVPGAEAPAVFWGHSEPTWLVNINSSVELGDFRFVASADGRGGHIVMDNGINAASTSFANTLKANEQTDPIFQAYREIGREPIGFHSGSFIKLREVSLRYNLPDRFIANMGAGSASLSVAARNVWTMWQRDREHFFSGERVLDPEITRPAQAFQGEQQATPPPLKSFDVTLRVSF